MISSFWKPSVALLAPIVFLPVFIHLQTDSVLFGQTKVEFDKNRDPLDPRMGNEEASAPPGYAESTAPVSNHEVPPQTTPGSGRPNIRATRRSGSKRSSAARCLVWFVNSAMFSCVLVAFILAPLAVILIGALNINLCQVEPMIPIWLIAFGSVFILLIFTLLFAQVAARQKKNLILRQGMNIRRGVYVGSHDNQEVIVGCEIIFCLSFVCLFLLGWFFVGNALVFLNWKTVEEDLSGKQCDLFLFFFTFSVIVIVYAFIAVPFCLFCIKLCHGLINS